MALLLRPMEETAHLFQDAFLQKGFETSRTLDWPNGTIILEFTRKQPTSDGLRNTLFAMYQHRWGRKPDTLEVVYRTGRSPQSFNSPICVYITASPRALSALLQQPKHVMLDKIEFSDWQEALPWEERIRVLDPGEEVPVIKMGLFKV